MEAFVLDKSRLVSDVIGSIAELKNTFQSTNQPINDDNTTLQRFCVKLETILRHEQKEKYSLLGYRKDYWSFIAEGISKDDGVRYVLSVPQVKSAQGKGRCFIRYALVQRTLADTIQRLIISKDSLSSWYRQESVFRNQSLTTALVNKLYDLNDIEFDLPCGGYDLDISWPAFSRRNLRDVNTSARRNSASSMTSVDFRNERQDPLVGLASEIASLKEFFNAETADSDPEANDPFDNISISTSNMETPPVSELTLKVSHVHQQALKWKATVGTERTLAAKELKKALEDRQFAIREFELKTKQLMEKYSNLAKSSSNESELKYSQFKEKLSEAEHALQDRETELRQLRNEVNRSVVESSTAQKSAIEFEKQLLTNDRKIREMESEIQTLKLKLQSKGECEAEFDLKEKRWKKRIEVLEAKEYEYKESVSELRGNLRAKEFALESIQESFEKLNGMVFGSFEELEAEMKERLLDKEKGLQNQTVENRKLELDLVELQQQARGKRVKLSETKSQLDDLQLSYEEVQHSNLQMQEMLKKRDQSVLDYKEFLNELGKLLGIVGSENEDDGDVKKEDIIDHSQELSDQVQSLQKELVQVSEKLNDLEINTEVQERELQQKITQLESLQVTSNSTVEEVIALKKTQDHLSNEKDSIEEELKAVLSSMEDLQTELSQTKELNDEQDQQLSVYNDDNHRQTELIDGYEQQMAVLRNECQDAQNSNETLGLDLSEAQKKVMLVDSENIELKVKLSSLEEELKILSDDKAGLVDEIDVARQQLESANEGRIRAEHAQVKAQEELENLQCMMDQEVAALKFQLSSETIKFETEKKVLTEQSVESARYRDRSLDQEDVIVDLESKLKERTDGWQIEKRKCVNEIKHLRSEVQLLKNALDGNKQKLMTLENDLLLTTKQRGEERSRQKDMKRKIKEINEIKIKSENDLKNKITEMEKDMRDLKDKVISLTREKAEIWKQADEMAHEIRIKASDRWVDDNEVNKCVNCKTEFSFIVRKHHCRLCGRIFCHSCVNNWVKTQHSSKLKRVCDYCLANDKQLKPQKIKAKRHKTNVLEEDFDETMSDVSIGTATRSASSSMLSFNDDEEQATASKQPKGNVSSSVIKRKEDEKRDGSPTMTTSSPIAERSTNIGTTEIENEKREDSRQVADDEYLSFANVNSSGRSAVVVSPDPEGFEVIDPHEDICEVTESRVIVSERDQIETLVIPAVNDEQGVSCECSVSAGVRYVIPVMVATPGAVLCWSFKTLYKSVIFGLGFKGSESLPYEEVETLFPLARYSSNLTPVEGEWKAASHGVYLLVFDNTYSRFTSKQLTCVFHIQRRPPLSA